MTELTGGGRQISEAELPDGVGRYKLQWSGFSEEQIQKQIEELYRTYDGTISEGAYAVRVNVEGKSDPKNIEVTNLRYGFKSSISEFNKTTQERIRAIAALTEDEFKQYNKYRLENPNIDVDFRTWVGRQRLESISQSYIINPKAESVTIERDIPAAELLGIENTPFSKSLVDSDIGDPGRVQTFKGNPNKLITIRLSADVERTQEKYTRARKIFLVLQTKFGINFPDFDVVFGPSNNSKNGCTAYTIRDKIFGKTLSSFNPAPQQKDSYQSEIRKLYTGLITFYRDIYHNGGDYLRDISDLFQFVYGHKVGEKENKIYVIDLDPLYNTFDPQLGQDQNETIESYNDFYSILARLRTMIESSQILGGFSLTDVEDLYKQFLGEINQEKVPEIFKESLVELKKRMGLEDKTKGS